jgi:DNA modification methylase
MTEVHLLQGDCLEILPTIPDMSVDAIITDLPYGTTACKWDVIIPLEPMWEQVKRLCKGAFVTTASQPFTSVLVCSNLEWFKYDLAWKKVRITGHLDAKRKPLREHESVLVFSANGHTYNPQMTKGIKHIRGPFGKRKNGPSTVYNEFKDDNERQYESDEYYPRSIVEFRTDMQPIHPTQKPVALYEYLIKTYTNPGDTVLDFCMGSGTTGCAAVKTGRNFIGIEREPKYFATAERRITDAQLQIVMPL